MITIIKSDDMSAVVEYRADLEANTLIEIDFTNDFDSPDTMSYRLVMVCPSEINVDEIDIANDRARLAGFVYDMVLDDTIELPIV